MLRENNLSQNNQNLKNDESNTMQVGNSLANIKLKDNTHVSYLFLIILIV
jgi:hypothetical protein